LQPLDVLFPVLARLGQGRRFRAKAPRHQPEPGSTRPRGQGPPPPPGGPVPGPDSDLGNNGGDRAHPSEHPRGPGLVQNGRQAHPQHLGPAVITSHPGIVAQATRMRQAPWDRSTEPDRVWTTEQLGTFLISARSHRLYAFYRLAAYTGARRGELLYLRWQAVDLVAAEVTFGGSTAVVRGQRVEGTTKGGRSRVVSIDRETVTILSEHRRCQDEERQAAGPAWTDSGGLVFTTKWGEPLYPDTVTALMKKLITAHNKSAAALSQALPHARLHDLRHLHATLLPVWPVSRCTSSRPGSAMPTPP